MNENDKYVCKGLGILLIHMIERDTDNVELTFKFGKIKAIFKVELTMLEELK